MSRQTAKDEALGFLVEVKKHSWGNNCMFWGELELDLQWAAHHGEREIRNCG